MLAHLKRLVDAVAKCNNVAGCPVPSFLYLFERQNAKARLCPQNPITELQATECPLQGLHGLEIILAVETKLVILGKFTTVQCCQAWK